MTYSLLAVGSNAALVTFLLYTLAVFALAWLANKALAGKSFMSEYFLGSRNLGVWAFALTFAATSASGGTFTGFPAKIYTHGWVLALWIASYMVVPICTMGLIGKRVNQMARRAGAITVPDLLRDRFGSRAFGLLATVLIVYFMAFNLSVQFKSGSVILQTLLRDVPVFQDMTAALTAFGNNHADSWLVKQLTPQHGPVDWGYQLCLILFGVAVIAYTTYGGFRAVVWTDVMQGIVMVAGVLIMLPLALSQVGGLGKATRELAQMTPPQNATLQLQLSEMGGSVPKEAWFQSADEPSRIFWSTHDAIADTSSNLVEVRCMEVTSPNELVRIRESHEFFPATIQNVELAAAPKFGANEPGHYVTAPGPSQSSESGFLPFGIAISFFFMWALSGTGQPQYMVRLMAFKNSQTLRRAILTVTFYFGLIYFPLVIIFCCARVLMPGLDHEADSVMPRMAVLLTTNAGHSWLAGLLVAAPFAAVMSTVDSFLLVVSSSLVRDVWQRNIDPDASEKTVKRLSYWTTVVVGGIALIGAVNPPQFLQDIIVYVGSGLAACFLIPVVVTLYWPRANTAGCIAGMLGGFFAHLSMHIWGMLTPGYSFAKPYELFGLSPVLIGLTGSLVATLAVTLMTRPLPDDIIRKYFGKDEPATQTT
ncbi:MAG: hypothetical protein KDA88_00435 [Planctomycetaceae bacterium]|nr:hypothetical protein [Planctomycetaceae bacterium]MCB9950321.1 hypothetical protein [Planctomycetaceae bacterium]